MILLENFDNKLAEFLSGLIYPNNNDNQLNNFLAVFMSFVSTISFIGSLAIYIKKCLSDRANRNMVQEIHITLEDQNQREPEQQQNNYNNCIYNVPMLNSYEILIIYPIVIIAFIVGMFNPQFTYRRDKKIQPNMTFLYVEIVMNYIVGMIIPIYVLIKKRTIRNHIWDLIKNLL